MPLTLPSTLPELFTPRMRLRALCLADAADVQRLAGDREVAATTRMVPHPYEDGMAEAWLSSQPQTVADGRELNLAITAREDCRLLGAMGLVFIPSDDRAEIGYWIGKPFWGRGYATEAARELLRYGFDELQLNSVGGWCMARNTASARVMEKAGMRQDGLFRAHMKKWGVYEDMLHFTILRSDPRST